MPSYVAKPIPPNQDKRWKLIDATIRRQGGHARGLIETLHTVQEAFGYLDEQALRYVAMSLRVPLSRAFGVATFYHFFTLKPAGEHTCVICMLSACFIFPLRTFCSGWMPTRPRATSSESRRRTRN